MTLGLKGKMTELAARRFRLLGEPMRLRILQALESGERPVHEIVASLGANQSNISKHLQALCHGGLVSNRREGLNVYYGIADPMVFKLCQLVCRGAQAQARAQLAQLSTPGPRRSRESAGIRR